MRTFIVAALAVFVTLSAPHPVPAADHVDTADVMASHTLTAAPERHRRPVFTVARCVAAARADGIHGDVVGGCKREAGLACWDEPKSAAEVAEGADPVEHMCGHRYTAPSDAVHFTAYPSR